MSCLPRWLVRPDDPLNFHDGELFLEITESTAFEYFDLCRSILREVCERTGAHLVVDDLGAGHSNLKRVLDLEPQVVKLDRELIRDADKSSRQRLLLQGIVELCIDLGRARGRRRHRDEFGARRRPGRRNPLRAGVPAGATGPTQWLL